MLHVATAWYRYRKKKTWCWEWHGPNRTTVLSPLGSLREYPSWAAASLKLIRRRLFSFLCQGRGHVTALGGGVSSEIFGRVYLLLVDVDGWFSASFSGFPNIHSLHDTPTPQLFSSRIYLQSAVSIFKGGKKGGRERISAKSRLSKARRISNQNPSFTMGAERRC